MNNVKMSYLRGFILTCERLHSACICNIRIDEKVGLRTESEQCEARSGLTSFAVRVKRGERFSIIVTIYYFVSIIDF